MTVLGSHHQVAALRDELKGGASSTMRSLTLEIMYYTPDWEERFDSILAFISSSRSLIHLEVSIDPARTNLARKASPILDAIMERVVLSHNVKVVHLKGCTLQHLSIANMLTHEDVKARLLSLSLQFSSYKERPGVRLAGLLPHAIDGLINLRALSLPKTPCGIQLMKRLQSAAELTYLCTLKLVLMDPIQASAMTHFFNNIQIPNDRRRRRHVTVVLYDTKLTRAIWRALVPVMIGLPERVAVTLRLEHMGWPSNSPLLLQKEVRELPLHAPRVIHPVTYGRKSGVDASRQNRDYPPSKSPNRRRNLYRSPSLWQSRPVDIPEHPMMTGSADEDRGLE